MQIIISTFRQRTRLDVHTVGDNWHGHQQTIAINPLSAQTQRQYLALLSRK